MSERTELNDLLTHLITDSELRAICVEGGWGVGKTYCVREFFDQHLTKANLKNNKLGYAYISLFGAQSVREIRKRLCASAIDFNGATLLNFAQTVLKVAKTDISVGGPGAKASLNLGAATELAEEMIELRVLKNLVICIDDLERKPESLSARDVLGLVAQLLERQDCKCILLFNAEKMGEIEAEFRLHEEKVFDLRFELKPSVKENLMYSGLVPQDRSAALAVFEAFQIANIRIMRRLAWVLRLLPSSSRTYKSWNSIVAHCALLIILKHSFSKEVPNILKTLQPLTTASILFGGSQQSGLPVKVEAAFKTLYPEMKQYTESVVQILDTGRFNADTLAIALKNEEASFLGKEFEEAQGAIWDYVIDGFTGNTKELMDRAIPFLESIPENTQTRLWLRILELVLRIDPSEKVIAIANRLLGGLLLHTPVEKRSEVFSTFSTIAGLPSLLDLPYSPVSINRKPEEIFARLGYSDDSWDPPAFSELAELPDDDFRLLFTVSGEGSGLPRLARIIGRMNQNVPVDVSRKLINRFQTVLADLSTTEVLHKIRADLYLNEPLKQAHRLLETRAKA